MNPLDYRIYVGLAHVYLAQGDFDAAMTIFQNSLPHAPKKEIDYKSYSYRLIGRIHFARENNADAVQHLKQAVTLSPTYPDAHYDYAQYAALINATDTALSQLGEAITLKPGYWVAARVEQTFSGMRAEVDAFLSDFAVGEAKRVREEVASNKTQLARLQVQNADLNRLVDDIEQTVRRAKRSVDKDELARINGLVQIRNDLKVAEEKIGAASQQVNPNDLLLSLDAQKKLNEASALIANTDQQTANARQGLQLALDAYVKQIRQQGENPLALTKIVSKSAILTLVIAVYGVVLVLTGHTLVEAVVQVLGLIIVGNAILYIILFRTSASR